MIDSGLATATTPRVTCPTSSPGPAARVLRPFMAGGGPQTRFSRWRAWPLPPAGPVDFVAGWPVFGVPETRVTLDAQPIPATTGRSTQLWPEDED
jgi:hypothetical protein